MVEFKRFEIEHQKEIAEQVFPKEFNEALARIQKYDGSALNDPQSRKQFDEDVKTVKKGTSK